MPLLGRMRRAVHPAAAFIFISSAFILFTLYSFLGQTLDDTVKRLQPAEKLKSSHEFQDKVISDINVLQELELKFLPNFKNPCWYDQGTHLKEDDTNLYSSWLKPASALVLANYRNQRKDGHVLRCLPYFFLIGQPKCATTDVFQRINIHPDIAGTLLKGPHWWTRRRYGQPYAPRPVTFAEYLDLFSGAASDIEESTSSAGLPYHGKITGDGSTSTLWDSGPTMNYLYSAYNHSALEKLIQGFFILREGIKPQHNLSKQNFVENYESHNLDIEGCCFARQRSRDDYKNYERTLYKQNNSHYPGVVLAITAADVVHAMLPKAKIVAVIREPVSRLFSSYVFFTKKREKTPDSFEQDVMSSIRKWNTCIAHHSERTCAYNKTLHNDLVSIALIFFSEYNLN
ncbi:Carbohydrate sulfotransferase 15 [Halocaridina rubra]|uniref:Carbohydrate sulfotransferase 15 n=1 Tax=Halocaridina rubra TaxID=373956 RepID=A0AAN8XAQ0_HALRR